MVEINFESKKLREHNCDEDLQLAKLFFENYKTNVSKNALIESTKLDVDFIEDAHKRCVHIVRFLEGIDNFNYEWDIDNILDALTIQMQETIKVRPNSSDDVILDTMNVIKLLMTVKGYKKLIHELLEEHKEIEKILKKKSELFDNL